MPAAVQQTDMYGTQVRGKLLAVHVAAAALGRGCETGGGRDSLICWQLPLVTPAMEMRPVFKFDFVVSVCGGRA
jgi:hypothetical protein